MQLYGVFDARSDWFESRWLYQSVSLEIWKTSFVWKAATVPE